MMFRLAEGEAVRVTGSPETSFNDAVQCFCVCLRFAGQLMATVFPDKTVKGNNVIQAIKRSGHNTENCVSRI